MTNSKCRRPRVLHPKAGVPYGADEQNRTVISSLASSRTNRCATSAYRFFVDKLAQQTVDICWILDAGTQKCALQPINPTSGPRESRTPHFGVTSRGYSRLTMRPSNRFFVPFCTSCPIHFCTGGYIFVVG